ncbi:hypothetical protein JXB41_04380 [Candidatus Woesearchaeota archaeon]|nr:hypothetical protein [Candidatus Woesearchaeota archaeon]
MKKSKSHKKKPASHGEPVNEICKGCFKWEKLGRKCSVFWEGKKWCTLKVTSMWEWQEQNLMLGRVS